MTFKKTVLITGTSRGIGLGLAKKFIQDEYIVLGCSRGQQDLYHENYHHFSLDLSDQSGIDSLVSQIKVGKYDIDLLINNAGIATGSIASLTSLDAMNKIMSVNFFAPFMLSKAILKLMIQSRKIGSIINISSMLASNGVNEIGSVAYATSKSALEKFSKIFAKEVAPFGVRCNVIALPFVDTSMKDSLSSRVQLKYLEKHAFKKEAQIDDIYNLAVFLGFDKSPLITGQTIYIGYIN